jgi:hypothetical protein
LLVVRIDWVAWEDPGTEEETAIQPFILVGKDIAEMDPCACAGRPTA